MLKKLILAMAIVFLSYSHSFANAKLSQIFIPDMLSVQWNYLEQITGPAKHAYQSSNKTETREYVVDGCKIEAIGRDGSVVGYSLYLNSKCNIGLEEYLRDGVENTEGITANTFLSKPYRGSMHVQSFCVMYCGNASEPSLDFVWQGPHSQGFISISFEISSVDTSEDKWSQWTSLMEKEHGQDYVMSTQFNCDSNYDIYALKALGDTKVQKITIGYNEWEHFDEEKCTKDRVTPTASAQTFEFPALAFQYSNSTDIQKKQIRNKVVGSLIQGQGALDNAKECGVLSPTVNKPCYQLTLSAGESVNIIVYARKTAQNQNIENFNVGEMITFKGCKISDIRSLLGFTRIDCDSP
jgi:hypothetical protein